MPSTIAPAMEDDVNNTVQGPVGYAILDALQGQAWDTGLPHGGGVCLCCLRVVLVVVQGSGVQGFQGFMVLASGL